MAGAMYVHSATEYDNDVNADLIMLMDDIGIIKSDQISAGVGYIYNYIVSKNSNIKLSYDARLSITYEWNSRVFINAYGQLNSFGYKLDQVSGRLRDWYINASIGVRL